MRMPAEPLDDPHVIAETRAWMQRAVVGLNLCPFAKAPLAKGLVRCVVSAAEDPAALLTDLQHELQKLARTPATQTETTLLVHPRVLTDFIAFNDFLGIAEELVADLGLDGVLQVASFPPDYQFADTDAADIGNATNRAPYPTLHLLREASIDRAVDSMPDPAAIYEANIRTLQALGPEGWATLRRQCHDDALLASGGHGNGRPGASPQPPAAD